MVSISRDVKGRDLRRNLDLVGYLEGLLGVDLEELELVVEATGKNSVSVRIVPYFGHRLLKRMEIVQTF